ncbi:MAG: hypothetical protein GXO66_04940 [Euryarchaeota archaeon]|nr:hypothetical protein [Euryarchaeota archaeon]
MATYRDALELVIRREFGVYGPEKIIDFAAKMGITVGRDGRVIKTPPGRSDRELLVEFMNRLREEFGEVSVISCRVALNSFFMKNGLENPL